MHLQLPRFLVVHILILQETTGYRRPTRMHRNTDYTVKFKKYFCGARSLTLTLKQLACLVTSEVSVADADNATSLYREIGNCRGINSTLMHRSRIPAASAASSSCVRLAKDTHYATSCRVGRTNLVCAGARTTRDVCSNLVNPALILITPKHSSGK